jgi:hypothetical protein
MEGEVRAAYFPGALHTDRCLASRGALLLGHGPRPSSGSGTGRDAGGGRLPHVSPRLVR